MDTDFIIVNNKELTHYPTNLNQPSAIDITMTSAEIRPICTWKTTDSLFGSDHTPIEIKILDKVEAFQNQSHKINTNSRLEHLQKNFARRNNN